MKLLSLELKYIFFIRLYNLSYQFFYFFIKLYNYKKINKNKQDKSLYKIILIFNFGKKCIIKICGKKKIKIYKIDY